MSNNNQDNIDKKFGLTQVALKNRTTVYFLAFLIVFGGLTTYISLPRENFPEVKMPQIYIGTAYPGNSPIDMENLVTRVIETEVNAITEVDKITSTSVQDYSSIVVEFPPGIDILQALLDVKNAVDKAEVDLPNDLPKSPEVFEVNFSEFPIVNLNLAGDYPLDQIHQWAKDLEDEIEKISEVSKVTIRGIEDKEVKIHLDPRAMQVRQVSFDDVAKAVANENMTQSAGQMKEGKKIRRTIRILGEYDDPSDMANIIIKNEKNNIIYLKDIGTVEYNYKETSNYARYYKYNVIMIDVVKKSGENLLDAMDKINALVGEFKKKLPKDLDIALTNDQSVQTRKMVSDLENNIISGVLLVVTVLLFFLGTRNALFVGIAIPLSMLITFLVLGFVGITINMMVLFSLIMALGMLVDNGIVVVENIYRLMDSEGYNPYKATLMGIGEVAWPIIASTATTLAAFLPLAFWPGIMGDFMKYLPITLIITLCSSLFVALVINPALIVVFMKVNVEITKKTRKRALLFWIIGTIIGCSLMFIGYFIFSQTLETNPLRYEKALKFKRFFFVIGNFVNLGVLIYFVNVFVLYPTTQAFKNIILPWLEDVYSRFLTFALSARKPFVFFFGTIALLFLSFVMFAIFPPNVLFFPESAPKYVNVFIEFPIGTDIERTNKFSKVIYKDIKKALEPYNDIVESIISNVGKGVADPNSGEVGDNEAPHKARLTINFADYRERKGIDTKQVLNEIRKSVQGYAGVVIVTDQDNNGPPVGKPISIEIVGNDLDLLLEQADEMKRFINNSGIEGIENLKPDVPRGKPELLIKINRENARRFGLSTGQVIDALRTSLFGKEISKFKDGKDEFKVQLRLQDKYRHNLATLIDQTITFRDMVTGKVVQIPIGSIANVKYSTTYGSIKRKNLDRIVKLESNVLTGYNATSINNQIKSALSEFQLAPGHTYRFGGEQEKQAEEMAFLSKALMVAVFLILLIIIAQFNSITSPIIIMVTVLLSTIGVMLGIVITRDDFIIIMTMIGIISLAGIVVNNAIVLIDFIDLGQQRMKDKYNATKLPVNEIRKLIIQAGKTRLRPVLLTAITTILGLIPLAVGINIDFISFFTDLSPNFFIGGDNVAFWGPMSWTIIYGLTFATFLTLVIVPVMYFIIVKIKRRLFKVDEKELEMMLSSKG